VTFDEAFNKLIDHEGEYVNDPRDPGGETKFGISKRQYPDLDIKSLTLEQARDIYMRDYWMRARLDEMPPDIAYQVFDGAVNSGIENATRWLQRAVDVADDGHVGPRTMEAIAMLNEVVVIMRFNGERLSFLTKLTKFDIYGRGWTRRVADNLKAA
jgi:lysozyme family protein